MGVQFDDTFVYEQGSPQIVRDAIKVYANWAGIHDFSFDNTVGISSLEFEESAEYWENYYIAENAVPHDCLLEFTINPPYTLWDGWAALIGFEQETQIGYAVGVDWDSGLTFLARYNAETNTMTKLHESEQWYFDNWGKVQISMRQIRFSEEESDLWHVFSMWTNGLLHSSWCVKVAEPIKNNTYAGFITQTNEITIDDFTVPQLTQFAEWASIDPGEAPAGGLERTIEGRYIKMFIRYDGSLRAWRSRPVESVKFLQEQTTYHRRLQFDKRMLYSHVRMLGGYAEAEYIDPKLLKYGHRFKEVNNPYILSDDECYAEAIDEIRRMREQTITQPIEAPFCPILEPEDRVTTPDGERIITRRNWRIQPGTITQSLDTRLYAYED